MDLRTTYTQKLPMSPRSVSNESCYSPTFVVDGIPKQGFGFPIARVKETITDIHTIPLHSSDDDYSFMGGTTTHSNNNNNSLSVSSIFRKDELGLLELDNSTTPVYADVAAIDDDEEEEDELSRWASLVVEPRPIEAMVNFPYDVFDSNF